MCKELGAFSVLFYNLVYVYNLSMKVGELGFWLRFWLLVTTILKFELAMGRFGPFSSVMCYVSLCSFVGCIVYEVFPHIWQGNWAVECFAFFARDVRGSPFLCWVCSILRPCLILSRNI